MYIFNISVCTYNVNHYFNFFLISYSTIRFGMVKYVYHIKEGDFT
uniref:Uncharacterized protein n=1 Tax=virus sp. ctDYl1 TaxID=2826795 RepID=A0A8S5R9K9_9VIRU|nr:MAG TPA: hypothetical protein [virus sp. ctDYl1]DAR52096.1 MAG TPA: hypothetical protein [Bacteriophage sp.]DAV13496.1 MAG TPA: hypothetical protein [Caudoviricetes sp.]